MSVTPSCSPFSLSWQVSVTLSPALKFLSSSTALSITGAVFCSPFSSLMVMVLPSMSMDTTVAFTWCVLPAARAGETTPRTRATTNTAQTTAASFFMVPPQDTSGYEPERGSYFRMWSRDPVDCGPVRPAPGPAPSCMIAPHARPQEARVAPRTGVGRSAPSHRRLRRLRGRAHRLAAGAAVVRRRWRGRSRLDLRRAGPRPGSPHRGDPREARAGRPEVVHDRRPRIPGVHPGRRHPVGGDRGLRRHVREPLRGGRGGGPRLGAHRGADDLLAGRAHGVPARVRRDPDVRRLPVEPRGPGDGARGEAAGGLPRRDDLPVGRDAPVGPHGGPHRR